MRAFFDKHSTDIFLFAIVCACAGFFGFIAEPDYAVKVSKGVTIPAPPPVTQNKLPLLIDVPRDFQPPED